MATIKVNVEKLYGRIAGRTSYVPWPVTLADGRSVAGIYCGFGRTVLCKEQPVGRGWNGKHNVVDVDDMTRVYVQD